MPQIKHIAIATNDAAKTAKFYSEVFGLREVAQLDGENAKGFMLSDGNINMAILDFQSDAVAGERGKDWPESGARTGRASTTSASKWKASRISRRGWSTPIPSRWKK